VKAGDIVLTRRFSDGAEIVGRLGPGVNGTWPVVDARGVIWRRVLGEVSPVAPGDPRLRAFAEVAAEPPAAAPPSIAETDDDAPPPRRLSDRILDALGEGLRTSVQIARRLDAMAETVSERLIWLEKKGRVVRTGTAPSRQGRALIVWALAEQAAP
jgi:hypothetical protein